MPVLSLNTFPLATLYHLDIDLLHGICFVTAEIDLFIESLGTRDPSVGKKRKICLHGIYAGGDGGAGNDEDEIMNKDMVGDVLCII